MTSTRWPKNDIHMDVKYVYVRYGKRYTYKTVQSLVNSLSYDASAAITDRLRKGVSHEGDRSWRWIASGKSAYRDRYFRRVTKLLKDRGIE